MRTLAALALVTALHLPNGFDAGVEATGLRHPTAMAFRPGGGLYITEDTGRLVVVPRGRHRPRVVAHGLGVPLGLVWVGRTRLVVSTQGRLLELTLNGPGRVTGARALVRHLPYGEHQQDNVVAFGGRLYFGSGSTCNACVEHDRRSATVLSVKPDGTDLRIVARGLRNPYGLVVDRARRRILVSVNGRDDLGTVRNPEPAEMVVQLRGGADFGWPRCWPSARLLRLVGACRGVASPLAYLEAHASADGMAFWRHELYVAEWGQYDSHRFGRRVVRVRLTGPMRSRVSVFASGFDHPLALAVDPAGALLVADWGRGVVYRIRRRSAATRVSRRRSGPPDGVWGNREVPDERRGGYVARVATKPGRTSRDGAFRPESRIGGFTGSTSGGAPNEAALRSAGTSA
jgi:glucose/arabinose dehydrogenase